MYTLRIPFELPSGYKVEESDGFAPYGHLEYKLKTEMHYFVLVVRGFSAVEEAEHFLSQSWSGFVWFLLKCGMAATWEREVQTVTISEDPAGASRNLAESFNGLDAGGELHGILQGARPAIFETSKSFMASTTGRATITQGASADRFFEHFVQGLSFENWHSGLTDDRLKVALEVYGGFFYEATPNAQFLTLIMVLEALAEPTERPSIAIQLIKGLHQRIEEALTETEQDSPERTALEGLIRETDFRRSDSIRTQIRSLVFRTLSQAGDGDADDVAREALRVYDARSRLIHTGRLQPGELESVSQVARPLVERVLTARFLQATQ